MDHSTRGTRRPRRAWPPPGRTAATVIATAALALLVACGGSPSTGSGGSSNAGGSTSSQSTSSQALAYTHCMRQHGVPNFPDPDSHGVLPKVGPDQVGVSQSKFQAADRACAHLLQPTQAQTQQLMTAMRNFAQCMRTHGVQNWPDPTTGSNGPATGQPVFDISGIDPNSPQIQTPADDCFHLIPRSPRGDTNILLCDGVGEGGECHGYGASNS